MSSENFVLIVTDDDELINQIAQPIKDSLISCDVKICCAHDFDGTDLLRSSMFILGCSSPNPASFSYLQEMLAHINLASRKCGIFSVNEESINYLRDILNDSEAVCAEPLLVKDGFDKIAIEEWAKKISG